MVVSPIQNYFKNRHDVNTTYEVTQRINLFLNRLYLLGITHNAKNQVVRRCGTVRFAIFFLSYVALLIACIIARFLLGTVETECFPRYLKFTTIWVADLFIPFTLISVFRTNVDVHQEYYSNYASIDAILKTKSKSGYATEKMKLEKLFFTAVALFFTKLTVDTILFPLIGINRVAWAYTDHNFGMFVMFIVMMSLMTKLIVFKRRFRLLVQEVALTLKGMQQENNNLHSEEKIMQYKRCYQLLCKQNFITSKLHGWQILVISIHLLLFLTRATYEVYGITTASSQLAPDFTHFLLMFNRIFFTCVTVVHLASTIENISDIRIQLLMLLEEAFISLEQKIHEKEEYRRLGQLQAQVRRQPLEFGICNMYRLDYRMLKAFISFTVTYTVILAQINMWSRV